jgi:hypothetical protein
MTDIQSDKINKGGLCMICFVRATCEIMYMTSKNRFRISYYCNNHKPKLILYKKDDDNEQTKHN